MEDYKELEKQMEELKKYQENPQIFIDKFLNPQKHVGHFLQVKVDQREKGFLVNTKYGTGRTKHSDDLIQGKLPVYLTDGRKVLVIPKNIKIKGFIN